MPDWSRIHRERRFGVESLPLALCSVIYRLGVGMRLTAFRKGVLREKSLPGYVLSVGNLTAGGTGKTPAVVMLARWAMDQGFRVAVLSRGYGAERRQGPLPVSDGRGHHADVVLAGDEPLLIARSVPEIPVIVSRRRYDAGLYAHERFGADFFILDDGFQHLQLRRDFDLVLLDADDPFGNGRLLPWGPLREPVNQLKRADAVVFTRARHVPPDPNVLAVLGRICEGVPVFRADHEPTRLIFPYADRVEGPDFLRGRRVVGFAGIGRPQVFEKTLKECGAIVAAFRGFADHYPYKGEDLNDLVHLKEAKGADLLVTTEKDWARVGPVGTAVSDMAYLGVRFRMLPGEEGIFRMIQDGFSG